MKHTVKKFDRKLPIFDDKHKKIGESQGYSFLDERGNCIIITYGEGRRDLISDYFNNKLTK